MRASKLSSGLSFMGCLEHVIEQNEAVGPRNAGSFWDRAVRDDSMQFEPQTRPLP
jgi:hypothetical protein